MRIKDTRLFLCLDRCLGFSKSALDGRFARFRCVLMSFLLYHLDKNASSKNFNCLFIVLDSERILHYLSVWL